MRTVKNKVLIIFILSILCMGCQEKYIIVKETSENVVIEDMDYHLSMEMDIEKYTPVMSSVPGLPLLISTTLYNDELDLEIDLECDQGNFLLWNEDGKVLPLESDYVSDFNDFNLYWSPDVLDDGLKASTFVIVTVIDKRTREVLEKRQYEILNEDDQYYYNDKEYEVLE